MSTDELYPDFKTVMFGDIEVPLSLTHRTRDLAPITAAEVEAHTKPAQPQKPRPAITAWQGADMDAYWLDNGVWTHCQTGEPWAPSLDDITAHVCDSIMAPLTGKRAA